MIYILYSLIFANNFCIFQHSHCFNKKITHIRYITYMGYLYSFNYLKAPFPALRNHKYSVQNS